MLEILVVFQFKKFFFSILCLEKLRLKYVRILCLFGIGGNLISRCRRTQIEREKENTVM
jgi:hypothetical protein